MTLYVEHFMLEWWYPMYVTEDMRMTNFLPNRILSNIYNLIRFQIESCSQLAVWISINSTFESNRIVPNNNTYTLRWPLSVIVKLRQAVLG